jgi:UDP:flavonoid glycosyltransferase YjiC (YdhE family)
MVALSMGLKDHGYDILFATHHNFEGFVTAHGLDFAPLSGNPQELINSEAAIKWMEAYKDPIKFTRQMTEMAGDLMDSLGRDIHSACKDSDGIIFSPLAVPALDVAEKYNIPLIGAGLQPLTPTGTYNPMMLPLSINPGRPLNYLLHLVILQVVWQPLRGHINRFRKSLGLSPYLVGGPYVSRFINDRIPVVYGFSPAFLPKPSDWPSFHHVTGYWFLDDRENWEPPQELIDFIDRGSKPFYIGFGSMNPREPGKTTELIIEAVERSDQRAILLSGWAGLDSASLPDSILKIDNVPHDWLFPKMQAVVHHGGAGTTAAGLRAGVPTIIAPFFSDQPFWGQRVEQIGVGPTPIPQKELTAVKLAEAMRQVVENPDMQLKASRIGDQILAEDGVQTAITVIDSYFGNP